MFKTNSRKGLGLASIVALVGSLIAGATPAQAAGEVSLETAKGTTYAALAGTTFELTVNAGSSIPSSSWNTLKTKVTYVSGSSYSSTVSATTGATFTGDTGATKSATTIVPATVSSTLSAYTVGISTADSSSDSVVTVQSWLDADGDGVVDAGEFASPVRTLTFYKTSGITWTTALTAPVLKNGNSTLSAVVSTNVDLNMSQLPTGEVKVAFATVAGTTYTASGAASHSAGVFNNGETASAVVGATTTAKAELGGISISAGATYVAVAIVDGIEASAEVYAVVSAANVANIDTPALKDDLNSKSGNEFRAGTGTVLEFTAQVSKSAGVAVAAGTAVTVTITEHTNMTSVSAVVAGGKTLANASATSATENITFTVAADAKGKVTIPVVATMKNSQAFKIKLSADNVVSTEVTVTAIDTAFGSIVDLTTIGSSVIKIVKGASANLSWAVLDNFGAPLSGDYRLYLTGGVTASAAVSAGQASFTVTPAATTTYNAQLQEYNTSTLAYADVSAAASDSHTVTVGASNAAAAVTLVASSASNLVINGSALSAVDARLGATAPTLNTGNRATLSGQVTDVNGIATYGVVTLSAPNVMFKVGDVYTLGSATVQTSATGAYGDVVVYSNTAGKVTVSATVGSASKDLGLAYLAAADTAGAKWVITAPSNVLPGSTAQFKAQLLDTWSNPVKVTTTSKIAVTYTGPGFVTAALPNTTDATGMLSFSVLFGTADTGTATVTFAYDGDATATTTTDNVAATATTTIGAAATPASDQKLTVGSFKGFVAIYAKNYTGQKLSAKVAGKWLVVNELTGFQRVVRNTGAGYTIKVDLHIDGVFVRSETVVTK